jgi:hypothetical protein
VTKGKTKNERTASPDPAKRINAGVTAGIGQIKRVSLITGTSPGINLIALLRGIMGQGPLMVQTGSQGMGPGIGPGTKLIEESQATVREMHLHLRGERMGLETELHPEVAMGLRVVDIRTEAKGLGMEAMEIGEVYEVVAEATTEETETEAVGIQDMPTSFAMGALKEGTSIGIALTNMLSAIPVVHWATIRTGATMRSLG